AERPQSSLSAPERIGDARFPLREHKRGEELPSRVAVRAKIVSRRAASRPLEASPDAVGARHAARRQKSRKNVSCNRPGAPAECYLSESFTFVVMRANHGHYRPLQLLRAAVSGPRQPGGEVDCLPGMQGRISGARGFWGRPGR